MAKLTSLPSNPTLTTNDLLYVVDTGTTTSYKSTIAEVLALVPSVTSVANTWTEPQTITNGNYTDSLTIRTSTYGYGLKQFVGSDLLFAINTGNGAEIVSYGTDVPWGNGGYYNSAKFRASRSVSFGSEYAGSGTPERGVINYNHSFVIRQGDGFNAAGGDIFSLSNTGAATFNSLANRVAVVIKGAVSQSANLQEWQNSTGSVLCYINPNGAAVFSQIYQPSTYGSGKFCTDGASASFGQSNITTGVQLAVKSAVATNIGVVIQGATSQTANLQEWQNNSGSILTAIDSNGRFNAPSVFGNIMQAGSGVAWNGYSVLQTLGSTFLQASSATTVPLAVRGATSQTANLTEWQNNAGSVVAFVSSTGNFATYGNSFQQSYNGNIFNSYVCGAAGYLDFVFQVPGQTKSQIRSIAGGAGVFDFYIDSGAGLTRRAYISSAGLDVNGDCNVTGNIRSTTSGHTDTFTLPGNATAQLGLTNDSSSMGFHHHYYPSQGIDRWVWRVNPSAASGATVSKHFTLGYLYNQPIIETDLNSFYVNAAMYLNNYSNNLNWQFTTTGQTMDWMCNAGGGTDIGMSIRPNNGFKVGANYNSTNLLFVNATTTCITPYSVANVPLTVKGMASQTANVTEWQNSTGAVMASVSATGNFSLTNQASYDSNPAMMIKGGLGQYVLQRWKDNSDNVIAELNLNGQMQVGAVQLQPTGATAASGAYLSGTNTIVLAAWSGFKVLFQNGTVTPLNVDNLGNLTMLGNITCKPAATATPANNGEMTFEATSNTSVKIKLKGSDGTVRSVTLTLA